MRSAEVTNLFRDIGKRSSPAAPLIDRIRIEGVGGLGEILIESENGLICLCGGTGHGKSAILKLIEKTLVQPAEKGGIILPPRFTGARSAIDLRYKDNTYAANNTTDGYPFPCHYVDLWGRTYLPLSYFEQNDIDILKEGVDPKSFSKEDIENISAACGKRYRKIQFYEVEGENDTIFPFFEADDSTNEYDSRAMSTGELSIFHICWLIGRCDRGEIVLIEEPEAYLPPANHRYAAAMMLNSANVRGVALITTTHSAEIVGVLPEKYVFPIRRELNKSVIAKTKDAKNRALNRMGLVPNKRAILIVEDDVAKELLSEIIDGSDIPLKCDVEVVVGQDGESGIRTFLRQQPKSLTSMKIVGILDGDQRAKLDESDKKLPVLFLPMEQSPDKELIGAIEENIRSFSNKVSRSEDSVIDALDEFKALDHHDRLTSIAQRLRISKQELIRKAFLVWANAHKKVIQNFRSDIARHVGV